ncbi:hypothetical protein [Nostoc commune]|nr:hypothetical protein [Nostoc commune]
MLYVWVGLQSATVDNTTVSATVSGSPRRSAIAIACDSSGGFNL